MEKYEKIKHRAHNTCDARNASNATVRIPTHQGQELELWNLAREITYQEAVKLEENQLKNVGILKASTGNTSKWLKSCVFTQVEKSIETIIKQFTAQKRQVEKEKMRRWKNKVM